LFSTDLKDRWCHLINYDNVVVRTTVKRDLAETPAAHHTQANKISDTKSFLIEVFYLDLFETRETAETEEIQRRRESRGEKRKEERVCELEERISYVPMSLPYSL
jgi:uncharacterized FlgJ-related protein